MEHKLFPNGCECQCPHVPGLDKLASKALGEKTALELQVDALQKEVKHRETQWDVLHSSYELEKERKDSALRLNDELRKVLELACRGSKGTMDCYICAAPPGVTHYDDSPCKILNTTEKRNHETKEGQ